MRTFTSLAIAIVVLLKAANALAVDAHLTWTHPEAAQVSEYNVYRDGQHIDTTLELSYVDSDVQADVVTYNVTAVYFSGGESAPSNTATFAPNGVVVESPDNLTVVADGTRRVYSIIQSRDNIVLVPVGTVAADVACNGALSVNGRYQVPVSEVTWTGDVEAEVVFASCEAE